MDDRKLHRYLAGGVFLAALGVYLKTMAPTVSFWDCGEFIACAYTLGIPHPPGSPLFVLIGRLFSLLPLGGVALRVNLVSALASAAAAALVSLITVRLIGLWRAGGDRLARVAGGGAAGLSLAFSCAFWFNATEAEVYGVSVLFTALALYVALVWVARHADPQSDRLLLFVAYLFGLGGGVHLLCLLTIPTILLLVIFTDPRPLRSRKVWVAAPVLFLLGYSTYLSLFIRSGMQPAIDQNDPETLANLWGFLTRKQYGEESMLLGIFRRKADFWGYQVWNMGVKYTLQQFPLPRVLSAASDAFRKASGPEADRVAFSPIPYALGVWGMIVHLRGDRRRFAALAAMLALMGPGLIVYLNMQDPQPRERDYVFVGAFTAFAVWMGIGAADLVGAQGRRLLRVGVTAAVLLVPVGIAAAGFRAHDRTGDTIASDYGYNILQTCDRDAVLFTNGDNDTFPLWYLQEVEGIRRDVRVVNLSLLNTDWYIRQLRDTGARLPIPLSDAEVEALCANTAESIERTGRYWPEAKAVTAGGITWTIPKNPYDYLRVQDLLVWKLIAWLDRKRPVYFAITVPDENTVGLESFLVMEGMAMRVGTREGVEVDADRAWRLLREVFRMRGVNDPAVYKEPDTASMLSNYTTVYLKVAEAYGRQGAGERVREVLRRCEAEAVEPGDWRGFLLMGRTAAQAGQREEAVRLLGRSLSLSDPADLRRRLPIADAMLGAGAFDRAVPLYREALARLRRADELPVEERTRAVSAATYNLALALDGQGATREAIATLEGLARSDPGDRSVEEALKYLREKKK